MAGFGIVEMGGVLRARELIFPRPDIIFSFFTVTFEGIGLMLLLGVFFPTFQVC